MVTIRIPGYDDYTSGSANLKTIVLGPHGVGKTRWSSFWDRPLILAAEDGTAAILDRGVPMAEILKSQDLLDTLALLKKAQFKPKAERAYRTVVLDTVDALQKMLMREWCLLTGNAEFTGWEAWSWLDAKQSVVIEKLMALDYHVIVLLHYKEDNKDDEVTIRPRLKGDLKDSLFDPFDLVGFMDWDFGAKDGERVQNRFLTYIPSPKAVFLKDRFHVMPKRLPVTFADSDYTTIFGALEAASAKAQKPSVVEVVPPAPGDDEDAPPTDRKATVASPEAGGPVPGASVPKAGAPKKAADQPPAATEPAAEPAAVDAVADALARAKAAQQGRVDASKASVPEGESPIARAQRLASQARAQAAAKATAVPTDAPAEAAAFTEALAAEVTEAPVAPPAVPEAPAVEPVEAASEPAAETASEPAAPEAETAPAAPELAAPPSTEAAVAIIEAAVGPVTEVDRMGLPLGNEGVGTGNVVPTHCGDTIGEVPGPVAALMEDSTVGCRAEFTAANQTFVNVSKIKYRAAFCDPCFTRVRQSVR